MEFITKLILQFAGPIGGLVEKGIFGGVVWLLAKGDIQGDAALIAGGLYTAFSGAFTGWINTQTAKATSIVQTQGNGITVVKKADAVEAGIPSVTAPQ